MAAERLLAMANNFAPSLASLVVPAGIFAGQSSGMCALAADTGQTADQRHSVERLTFNLDCLADGFTRSSLTTGEAFLLIDVLVQTTETLIWGEKNNASLFDIFCEKSTLALFIATFLLRSTPQIIRVQLLQTLSMLVSNARRDTTTFYLFSGGHLNNMLTGDPDLRDEEVRSYFVAFVKSLSLRLDAKTALLLVDRSSPVDSPNSFPLFAQAVFFAMHKDHMIATAARTALLSLLAITQPDVQRCTLSAAQYLLVPSLVQAFQVAWAAVNTAASLYDAPTLSRAFEAEDELLLFVNDLFLLDLVPLNDMLAQRILTEALLPLLVGLAPPVAYTVHTEDAMHIVDDRKQEGDNERWLALEEAMDEPTFVPEALLSTPSARSAQGTLVCSFDQVSTRLQPVQQGLVGAVIQHLLFGEGSPSGAVSFFKEPARSPERPAPPTGTIRHAGSRQGSKRSNHDEKQTNIEVPAMPTAAVALHIAGTCLHSLSTHRSFTLPLETVLLGQSLQSALVVSMYAPGPEGVVAEGLFDSSYTAPAPAGRGGEEVHSVPIPNPFREEMFHLLSNRPGDPSSRAEGPLVAWVLVELAAVSQQAASALHHRQLADVLCASTMLPRIAQRVVSKAIVELVLPQASVVARQETTSRVGSNLLEACRFLQRILRREDASVPSARRGARDSAEELLCAFVEEWEWGRQRSAAIDLPTTCGSVQCLLQCMPGRLPEVSAGRGAVRVLFTLRRLLAELTAPAGTWVTSPLGGRTPEEQCPLSLSIVQPQQVGDSASLEREGREALACAGPDGFGYVFLLHPDFALIAGPPSKASGYFLESPIWLVSASADVNDPLLLLIHVASAPTVGNAAAQEAKQMRLSFADPRGRTRALQHLEQWGGLARRNLLASLGRFVDEVIQETERTMPHRTSQAAAAIASVTSAVSGAISEPWSKVGCWLATGYTC